MNHIATILCTISLFVSGTTGLDDTNKTAINVASHSEICMPDVDNIDKENRMIEMLNYAIYPHQLVETPYHIAQENPGSGNQYVHHENVINIWFPQLYYSNEYTEVDWGQESEINQMLFEAQNMLVTTRDVRVNREYVCDYEITKAEDEEFSIKYYGYYSGGMREGTFCGGCTINIKTGERMELTDYITLDETIVDGIRSGKIEYRSSIDLDVEKVIMKTESFLQDCKSGSVDLQNCFYLSDDEVNLIIDTGDNYVILILKSDMNDHEHVCNDKK